jgi:outer membrane protein assembly factor BamB
MYPALIQIVRRPAVLAAALVVGALTVTRAADWPEWRGPSRDGSSTETNLPSKWSPAGENLAWRIPIGSRSSPVVFGNRIYLNTPTGDPANTQERLVAIDAETGKVVWEKRFSQYLSDVPQHRASWASPAVDPETGNIYLFTVSAQLVCHTHRATNGPRESSRREQGTRVGPTP